jgi:hypothetical protein
LNAGGSPRNIFVVTRWVIAWFVIATTGAMVLFPGGTYLQRSTQGYSFFGNFLSDLGMLVAWGGQQNHPGAVLFITSELLLAVTLVLFFRALVRLYSPGPPRVLAIAAGITGLICCLGFIAAAVLPADRFLGSHIQAAIFAFRSSLASFALFAMATARDGRFRRTAAAAWILLTVVMAAYVGVIEWGPRPRTAFGLTFQVTAQKIVIAALFAVIVLQSVEAERIAASTAAAPAELHT